MAVGIPIKPELIRWAAERSRLPFSELRADCPHIDEWVGGEKLPTMRQLEKFARKAMTPLGYLFLAEPPTEVIPIPDFRTVADASIRRPSPNLIETIHTIQRRQDWMREYLVDLGHEKLPFIGESREEKNPVVVARRIRSTLNLADDWSERCSDWQEALRKLRSSVERAGIFSAFSSTVGTNTNRKLDIDEFRGFVLSDDLAPWIFVNSSDAPSAQMFTFAHELAHLWYDQDALVNLPNTMAGSDRVERICNGTAAEFLMPAEKLRTIWPSIEHEHSPFRTLALRFKVSPIAVARRLFDMDHISREAFFAFYRSEREEWLARQAEAAKRGNGGGPSFYLVHSLRLGRRFSQAVRDAASSGKLTFQEAFRLTEMRGATFDRYFQRLQEGAAA